jgi:hypothetical protein
LPVVKPSPLGGVLGWMTSWPATASSSCCAQSSLGGPAQEPGLGSGMRCQRRLRDWQGASVWHQLHLMLLGELRGAGRLGFSRASIDGTQPPGSPRTGPDPTDRGKLGSKRHVVTDRAGIPLVFCITGANRHDSRWSLRNSSTTCPPSEACQDGQGVDPYDCTSTRATTSIAAVNISSAKAFRIASPVGAASATTPARASPLGGRVNAFLTASSWQAACALRAQYQDLSDTAQCGLQPHLRPLITTVC